MRLNPIHIIVWRLSSYLSWKTIYDIKSVHNYNSVLYFFFFFSLFFLSDGANWGLSEKAKKETQF